MNKAAIDLRITYPTYTTTQLKDITPKLGDVYAITDGKRTRGPYVVVRVHNGSYTTVEWDETYIIFVGVARKLLIRKELRNCFNNRGKIMSKTPLRACAHNLCKMLRQ